MPQFPPETAQAIANIMGEYYSTMSPEKIYQGQKEQSIATLKQIQEDIMKLTSEKKLMKRKCENAINMLMLSPEGEDRETFMSIVKQVDSNIPFQMSSDEIQFLEKNMIKMIKDEGFTHAAAKLLHKEFVSKYADTLDFMDAIYHAYFESSKYA